MTTRRESKRGSGGTSRVTRLLIEAMAKHLPPGSSQLRLLDLTGNVGNTLAENRADLQVQNLADNAAELATDQFDVIVGLDQALVPDMLTKALNALRPGGRLILMDANGDAAETSTRGQTLAQAGYTRILVESGIECPLPTGVLMRGEKP